MLKKRSCVSCRRVFDRLEEKILFEKELYHLSCLAGKLSQPTWWLEKATQPIIIDSTPNCFGVDCEELERILSFKR